MLKTHIEESYQAVQNDFLGVILPKVCSEIIG
jgi:hypothetical protein